MRMPRPRRAAASIPLGSTADVAFLLLIFFMVLARAQSQTSVDWEPAQSRSKLSELADAPVTITIDQNNNIFVNGQPTPSGNVQGVASAYLGDRQGADRKVVLKVDRNVPASIFQEVMLDMSDLNAQIYRVLDPPQAGNQ